MASDPLDDRDSAPHIRAMLRPLPILFALLAFSVALPAAVAPVRAEINLLRNNPLVEAANENDVVEAEAMLNRGSFVDTVDEKRRTPLIIAAIRGFEDMADVLVRFRANVNAADEFGNTPMFYAASGDHLGIMEILLEAEAEIDAKNRRGVTPLIAAAGAGRLAAVQFLLEHKANPAETDFTGRTAREWALRNNHRAVAKMLDRYEKR